MDYSLGVWELREAERTEEAKNQKWNPKSYLTTQIIEKKKKKPLQVMFAKRICSDGKVSRSKTFSH